MSWSLDLFIASSVPLEDLSREIGSLLGLDFKRVDINGGFLYEHNDSDFFLGLSSSHDMENDRDMNFEDFSYLLEVLPSKSPDWRTNQDKCLRFARGVFEKLKATGRYRLLFTENLQKKLDAFDPHNMKRQPHS